MSDAATRLAEVHDRIVRAARAARRDPADVTLIAVSKRRSADEIEELIAAGVTDFGENRVDEAAAKWPVLSQRYPNVRLHMVGRLQSNKAPEAVALFDAIHSLDRSSLLAALADAIAERGKAPDLYVQVNIGEEEQKGGVSIAGLEAFLDRVRATGLPLTGLMAMPPKELEAGPFFALLAKLARRHAVTGLSMGMSSDYPSAVMLGATAVRVGTALFDQ